MIHFGQMRCGKVDQYGGLFHVVTEFFHVNFLPIVPMRSLLVPDDPRLGGKDAPQPVRLSGKSVLMAWVRTLLVFVILFNGLYFLGSLIGLLVAWAPGKAAAALRPEVVFDAVANPLALFVGFAIFLGLTYRVSRARYDRAVELAAVLGLSEDDLNAYLAGGESPALPADAPDAYAN